MASLGMDIILLTTLFLALSAAGSLADDHQDYQTFPSLLYTKIPGADQNLTSLDIYAPKTGAKHPIVIYLHGGGLYTGDKKEVKLKPGAFTKAGYLFASVNYRLSPAVKYPAHIQDTAKAVAFIYKNAAKYGGDPDRIFLLGHSSGAHLAALLATDEQFLSAEGLSLKDLKGVICLDEEGYDLPLLKEIEPKLFSSVYIMDFGNDPEIWKQASPIAHVAPGKGIPPFLLLHLGGNTQKTMAQNLAAKLKNAGVATEVVFIPSKTHYALTDDLGKPGDQATKIIFNFLAQRDREISGQP